MGKQPPTRTQKISGENAILNRAENLVTEQEDKNKETSHIKKVLRTNGYKPWMFKIPKKKNKDEPENINRENGGNRTKKHLVGLPYTKGLSEEIQRIFKSHAIPTYHKPSCALRQMLVHPTDKSKKEQQCGVVYEITCETARTLGTRLKEHTTTKGQQHQPSQNI